MKEYVSSNPQHSLEQADHNISSVKDFIALTKPGVMALVVYSGLAGALLAPGTLHPFLLFVSILAIAMGSGGAASLNMWYDRDIDSLMTRTKRRPIPAGRILPDDALSFGVIISLFSVLIIGLTTHLLASIILASSILFYVFVYTMFLKRRTPQNIVIGGAAGAFPPLIGWASVTGGITFEPLLLFLIIFLWTPYHFWALALYRSDDYERALVPMLPVIKGPKATKIQITVYGLLTFLASLAFWGFGFGGLFYGFSALGLGVVWMYYNSRLFFGDSNKASIQLFKFSIFHLFLLLTAMMIDQGIGG